jgi:hypothetical protein
MHSIHLAKVRLWIGIEDPQPRQAPCPPEVNPQVTVIRKRVADPIGAAALLNDDDESVAVVEISHRDAAPLTRSTTDGLDDERVPSGVRRPRDASEKGQVSNRVRETGDRLGKLRKSHLGLSSCPTIKSAAVGGDKCRSANLL